MLAYRVTYKVKRNHGTEAFELLSAQIQRTRREGQQIRVYRADISPNLLVFESIHESDEAHQEFWAEVPRDPQSRGFHEKWCEVTEEAVGTERWRLTEWR